MILKIYMYLMIHKAKLNSYNYNIGIYMHIDIQVL